MEMEHPKKKKRQLSEKQKAHLARMREKKLQKLKLKKQQKAEQDRIKEEENMKKFKESVEGKKQNKETPYKPQIAPKNNDDDFLFRNMERMIGLMERMNKIRQPEPKQPVYQQPIQQRSKPVPIPKKEKPKVNLYGYDDFF